jgi:Ring finger domain
MSQQQQEQQQQGQEQEQMYTPINLLSEFDSAFLEDLQSGSDSDGDEWVDVEEEEEEEEEAEEAVEEEPVDKCACCSSSTAETTSTQVKPLFELPEGIELGECCICYEEMVMNNFTVTECGHKFHSKCIFKNLAQRLECPMCRVELLQLPEEEDDEDDDDEDDGDENLDDDDDEEEPAQAVTISQLASKLTALGYTLEDVLHMVCGSNHPLDLVNQRFNIQDPVAEVVEAPTNEPVRSTYFPNVGSHVFYTNEDGVLESESNDLSERLSNDIDLILEGKITMSHRDTRSYASVALALAQPKAVKQEKHKEESLEELEEEIIA